MFTNKCFRNNFRFNENIFLRKKILKWKIIFQFTMNIQAISDI